jgi:hypothetical protein
MNLVNYLEKYSMIFFINSIEEYENIEFLTEYNKKFTLMFRNIVKKKIKQTCENSINFFGIYGKYHLAIVIGKCENLIITDMRNIDDFYF